LGASGRQRDRDGRRHRVADVAEVVDDALRPGTAGPDEKVDQRCQRERSGERTREE
jgi:hypothetical protein